jgi:hypothetical protein
LQLKHITLEIITREGRSKKIIFGRDKMKKKIINTPTEGRRRKDGIKKE